jgi:hypothetical protein
VVACTIDINGKKSNLTIDEIACLYNKLVKTKKEPTLKTVAFDEDHATDMVLNSMVQDVIENN